jgi:hypothetical protein
VPDLLTNSFEEVERFEGVGGGVVGLLWLWKCVENVKSPTCKSDEGTPDHLRMPCLGRPSFRWLQK